MSFLENALHTLYNRRCFYLDQAGNSLSSSMSTSPELADRRELRQRSLTFSTAKIAIASGLLLNRHAFRIFSYTAVTWQCMNMRYPFTTFRLPGSWRALYRRHQLLQYSLSSPLPLSLLTSFRPAGKFPLSFLITRLWRISLACRHPNIYCTLRR